VYFSLPQWAYVLARSYGRSLELRAKAYTIDFPLVAMTYYTGSHKSEEVRQRHELRDRSQKRAAR